MKMIPQPKGSNLCGQCCIAFIAAISLEKAIKTVGKKGLTSPRAISKALTRLGFDCPSRRVKWSQSEELPFLSMIAISRKKDKNWHWMVYWNKKLYDPAGRTMQEYIEDGWRVTSYLPINKKSPDPA